MMKFKQTRKKKKQTRKSYAGMWRFPRDPHLCCIYRVPKPIRDVNPEAYTPQLVLIGPLNRSLISQALKSLDRGEDITYTKSMGYLNMEEHKKTYVRKFVEIFGEGEKITDEFRRTIEDDEEIIRESYSESTDWIQSLEFVEMVMHDSVFIFMFLIGYAASILDRQKTLLDPIYDPCLRNAIMHDLMLLENQLPYFILEKLFDPIVTRIGENTEGLRTFRELITPFFVGKITINSKFRHITDMFRCVHVETLPKQDEENLTLIQHMYNADKLHSGGVKFKAEGEEFSLNVTFKNGCLTMPCLTVHDQLEMGMRNIMAFEQCHYPTNPHVCNYITFLDHFIDTEKDVDLLVEKGIIKNWIGEPALVARMVNKLGISISEKPSYYSRIAVEVNAYYSNPFKGSLAVLKRVYFSNLWTGTATIAATFLLVMTLIQTVASIIQVMQNASK